MSSVPRRVFALGIISAWFSMAFPAFAATKPQIKCRFAGQTTTLNGRLFTCVKVKSKGKTILTWDSGKVIPVAKSTPPPTASPTATPSATQTPGPVEIKNVEIAIANTSEVPNNSTKSFTGKNRYGATSTYLITRSSDGLICMNATCTHNGCTVKIESAGLLCPCHNALFDVKDGAVLRGPAAHPLERVSVREADGIIYVTD
jgi:Rieske Fe-S protein